MGNNTNSWQIENVRSSRQIGAAIKKKASNRRNDTFILYLMMLPAIILLIIYHYIPMAGIVIAFQDFDVTKGFFGSTWIGLDNYSRIINMPESMRAFTNTLNIAFWKIVVMLISPVALALLLNEVRKTIVKRTVQTIIYLPHFLSWVILAGILKELLTLNGMVNQATGLLGINPVSFLGSNITFVPVVVISHLWKEVGFSTIVYLAAITSVDPTLYEAAIMDGAGKWKQTLHVTIPGMSPIIILCSVLSLGGILNAGADQILNLYSFPVYQTGDIIDTFVFRAGVQKGQYAIATAVGLFKSVVSLIFISTSYYLAKKLANYEIF